MHTVLKEMDHMTEKGILDYFESRITSVATSPLSSSQFVDSTGFKQTNEMQ